MTFNEVSNLSGFMADRNLASRTKEDLEYIQETRESLNIGNNSNLLRDWYERYDEDYIREAKRRVSKLDNIRHEGDAIHMIQAERLDRASKRMREYMGVNPYTRRDLMKQTLDLPYTDRLVIGKDKLSDNFLYREIASGISTPNLKTTHIYSDAEKYIDKGDKEVVLKGWSRMLDKIKKAQLE